jgi:hypothetical protein
MEPVRTRKFWADAGERAVRAFSGAALSMLTGAGVGILDVNWLSVLSVSTLASVVSILMSITSSRVGVEDTASFVR